MRAVKLEVPSRQQVDQIAADPEPDWSFDALLSELNSLEKKLYAVSPAAGALAKTQLPEFWNGKSAQRRPTGFVMRVSDDEMEGSEDESEEGGDTNLVEVKRFHCDGLYMSDSDESDYELSLRTESHLMGELGLVDAALVELSHEHQLGVTEEIRNQISALEIELFSENEKSASAIAQIEKYREARREVERKLDTQYQRKIAEALDKHITAVQRDHEIKSQIEEKKIRSDAAHEEAKRKEKALQEERLRQERARAEAEVW
uniref:Protein GLE1 isoform X2 n=1 Tax=Rhizophora mucronata TaxID=61149 RepID=A0A2P2KI25_RHIMU